MLYAALLAGEAFAAQVTVKASDAQVGKFDVPLQIELGIVDLVTVWNHAAVGHDHEILHK